MSSLATKHRQFCLILYVFDDLLFELSISTFLEVERMFSSNELDMGTRLNIRLHSAHGRAIFRAR